MEFSRQEYWGGLPFPSPIYIYFIHYIHTYIYISTWRASHKYNSSPTSLSDVAPEWVLPETAWTEWYLGNLIFSTTFLIVISIPMVISRQMCACMLSCSVVSKSVTPMDCRPLGSSVHGILQARMMEWIAISSIYIYIYTYGLIHCCTPETNAIL